MWAVSTRLERHRLPERQMRWQGLSPWPPEVCFTGPGWPRTWTQIWKRWPGSSSGRFGAPTAWSGWDDAALVGAFSFWLGRSRFVTHARPATCDPVRGRYPITSAGW